MNDAQTLTGTHSGIISSRGYAQALWIVGFAALTAVGAQIEIPHVPVPYTAQSLIVLLSGAMLGKRNGFLAQGVYLLAGLVGLPVFAQLGFGFAKLIGPTGGYLLSFPLAAFAVGYILEGDRTFLRSLAAMIAGVFIIFTLGTLQLYFVYYHDLAVSVTNGFLIFSWWDGVKVFAAAGIVSGIAHARRQSKK
jgi:biotin transport system substrate-specific component